MVFLENDAFLSELTKMFQRSRDRGTVFLTMKKYDGRDKPRPRDSSKAMDTAADNLCLLRATSRRRKIRTVVSSKEVNRFQLAYAALLKAHLDGLRKREKKGKKEERSPRKAAKATQ